MNWKRRSPEDDNRGLGSEIRAMTADAAHHGTGISHICLKLFQNEERELSDSRDELCAAYEDIANPVDGTEQAKLEIPGIKSGIRSEVDEFSALENENKAELIKTQRTLNSAKEHLGVTVIHKPDPWKDSIFLAGLLFLETLATGSIFMAGGAVPTALDAFRIGFIVSFTNVLCSGFLGGYLCGRNLFCDRTALRPRHNARLRQGAAWVACLLVIAVLGYFHLLVGIARTEEAFEGLVLSPEQLSALRQELFSLLAVLAGVLTSIAAWYKGLTSFVPRHPELAELEKKQSDLVEDTRDRMADAKDVVRDRLEDGLESIEDAREGGEEIADKRREYRIEEKKHDDRINEASLNYATNCAEVSSLYRRIDPQAGNEAEPVIIDDETWDSFRADWVIPNQTIVAPEVIKEILVDLQQAAVEAFERIERAWVDFHDHRNSEHRGDSDAHRSEKTHADTSTAAQPARGPRQKDRLSENRVYRSWAAGRRGRPVWDGA